MAYEPRETLTAKTARALLNYDPATGVLTWRPRTTEGLVGQALGHAKVWNIRYAETPTGALSGGYLVIRVHGKLYRAHRIAWLIATGRWPANQIDHINGQRADNRLANLREATGAENNRNQRARESCTGLPGAYRNGNGFMASIKTDGKSRYLGQYATRELAHQVYLAACRNLGFDPLHSAATETRAARILETQES